MNGRIKRGGEKSPSIPIIGSIKVGEKTDRGIPTGLDYFKCDSKYKELFIEEFGEKPNKISICFFSDSFQDSCNERYECRDNKGKLAGKGDGENWYLYNEEKNNYLVETDEQKIKSEGKWEIILTINFIIPKIKVFGLFRFSTKAKKSSLNNIRDTFDSVQAQAGTVIGVPFDLIVEKVVSQKPGSKHSFPVVNMVPNISAESMETLHNYLNAGNELKSIGLITDQKIKELPQ